MSQRVTAYELLGVDESANLDELKQAFHIRARVHHPDRGGHADDFLHLKKAFDLLSDPKRRELLGQQLIFEPISLRIQPSRTSNFDQLLKNLDLLKDKINKAS